ncbi:MAG TPA: HAD family hydrolase [Lentisphaeria bacterium]|nr:MAG: hypothetical protein A2X47_13430 [Lentisphaerae bacterium GWF2_38_69]HBM14966.1 HAD family hydrolase [Lentisphaeria bacterium]
MKYDLVIFDCDGVLVDREPIANRIFAELINSLGYNFSYEECEGMFTGRSDNNCLKILEERTGKKPPKDLFSKFDELAFEAYERELQSVEGVKEIISLLKFNDFCMASNAPEKKIHKALKVTGLYPEFENKFFSCSMVARPKQFPDLFLYAAMKMNASPKKCVVIEDSPFGVNAAISAGMDVFGYCARTDQEILKKAGAETFNDMALLKEFLGISPVGTQHSKLKT